LLSLHWMTSISSIRRCMDCLPYLFSFCLKSLQECLWPILVSREVSWRDGLLFWLLCNLSLSCSSI
jgi:hypothetical protein